MWHPELARLWSNAGRGHRMRYWPWNRARPACTSWRPGRPRPFHRPRPFRAPQATPTLCPAARPAPPRPQAPQPPSLLGAAGPGVWRCRSRARPGSAATATATAGSSSPSIGEARGAGRGGARPCPLHPGRPPAAPAGARGLVHRAGRGRAAEPSRGGRRPEGRRGHGRRSLAPPRPAGAREETVEGRMASCRRPGKRVRGGGGPALLRARVSALSPAERT